jgi:mono/diheme cytochrome c family protein
MTLTTRRWLTWIGGVTVVFLAIVAIYAVVRLTDDTAVAYDDARDHFKYGSTGGERGWKRQLGFGVPYWIWIAMPELFPDLLPDHTAGKGYTSFGMIYEDGKDPRFDLPIGMSMRRTMGIDRVYFTCSVCHTGTYRDNVDGARHIVLGMPANTFNFGRVAQFLSGSAKDWRFQSSYMMPKIAELADARSRAALPPARYRPSTMGVIDRLAFQYVGMSLMRDQLISLLGRLDFIDFGKWGPGRVDTFDPPKALLGFRMNTAHAEELNGVADFPSVWNQKARKGMWLHWDGNNCSVDERNLSAGFGTGATPATIDRDAVTRIADWLWEPAQPPPFPASRIRQDRVGRGETIYREYCQTCHGTAKAPFRQPGDGTKVGQVTPLDLVKTDRHRLDTYTPELARAQGSLYAGYPPDADSDQCREYVEDVCRPVQTDADVQRYRALRDRCYPARFQHFRKTNGYANMPLDGLWLRAPYLHNGSVPTLRALLDPQPLRPAVFYIGYDVFDFDNVGFVSSGPEAEKNGWRLDTSVPGNGNGGHEGHEYGTELSRDDKDALIEYLKGF